MNYSWSLHLYDDDGDISEECLLAHIGENTILKFQDSNELERFANRILGSLPEIRENEKL